VTRQVEIRFEPDSGFAHADGASSTWIGLRVRYRFPPERRWAKFLISHQPGQTLLDVIDAAILVISYDRGNGPQQAVRTRNGEVAGAAA
jgi:hypothetical protein